MFTHTLTYTAKHSLAHKNRRARAEPIKRVFAAPTPFCVNSSFPPPKHTRTSSYTMRPFTSSRCCSLIVKLISASWVRKYPTYYIHVRRQTRWPAQSGPIVARWLCCDTGGSNVSQLRTHIWQAALLALGGFRGCRL